MEQLGKSLYDMVSGPSKEPKKIIEIVEWINNHEQEHRDIRLKGALEIEAEELTPQQKHEREAKDNKDDLESNLTGDNEY